MQIMWIKLLIQCFLLSAAECGSHSLEFLSTGRVKPGDQPQFEQLTVFDGVPISYCDSLTRREEFKPSLESKNLPQNCDEASYNMLESLFEIPRFLNNTVYIVQRRRGCIQSANGVVSAFEAWAVNGMDFMSFDPISETWTSHSTSAVTLEHRWNNNNDMNFAFRHFIRQRCPEMIQRIKLRSIDRKTDLRVFAKPTADTNQALLRCHMTTTDKSVRLVHLTGDGASKASWITVTKPMPSEDGCVILRLTAGISLRHNTNKYGCTVQTGGHNLTVFWDGNTLDGRRLLKIDWRIMTIFVVCGVMFTITLISCGTLCLLTCVEKSRRHSEVDPQLMEQFTRMVTSVTTPDLQRDPQSAERSREWEHWAAKVTSADEKSFDPEFYANQVNGALW